MKKKGFTLIEMIMVMAIMSLMIGVIGSMFIAYSKTYKKSVLENRGFNYLNEAISLIEKEINQEANHIKTEGNIIKISYFEDSKVNYIKRINDNIFLLYGSKIMEPRDDSYRNIIIDNIKDFIAVRHNNMIYIKIVWNNGDCIERCLGIENAN
jgi:prepilin-type N-terminal cleavage/methylation domain-containing protein